MARSHLLSLALLMVGVVSIRAYYLDREYRETDKSPNVETLEEVDETGSDFDDGFGSDLDNFVTKNPLKCPHKCQYSLDCCPGNICLKRGSNIGYCVKGCKYASPSAPMKDCRLCMTCQRGYVCTLRLNGNYICLPDNRTRNGDRKGNENGQGKIKSH